MAKVGVDFAGQEKIEGIQIQVEVIRGWSTRKGKWPSRLVKSTQSEEYREGKDGQGELQPKVDSVIPEMEWRSRRGIADVAQIHPRMNREEQARATSLCATGAELRAPGMAPALLTKVFQIAKLYVDLTYAIAVLEFSNHIIH